MIAAFAFGAGVVAGAALWWAMRRQLSAAEVLRRQNYRGHELPVAAGVVIVLAVVAVSAAYLAWERFGGISPDEAGRSVAVLGGGVLGYGFIGLLDDLIGAPATKGFRGHLTALARGELTTGMVKLVWGVLVGFIAVAGPLGGALRAGLLIAATANLANLFDRAPGRVVKVSLLGAVIVACYGAPGWALCAPMLTLGAGAGLLVPDLRERCMLGDTGANVLGAAVGYGLVVSLGPTGEWVALGIVVALNAASEFVSFTRVIDGVAPLRWVDRLGTLPARRR